METDQQKAAFAARLNAICDDNNIPPKGKGRQQLSGNWRILSDRNVRVQ